MDPSYEEALERSKLYKIEAIEDLGVAEDYNECTNRWIRVVGKYFLALICQLL